MLGDAIYHFRNNCSLEISASPKIKFINTGSAENNYELIKSFVEYATKK